MIESTVCCVMLTADRPELAARAVRCFREQTYPNKRLLIYNTGREVFEPAGPRPHDNRIYYAHDVSGQSIGQLRNKANECDSAEILIHFDDDDWSHPNRIAEQVAFLQSSGKECVGYRDMLFWETYLNKLAPGETLRGDHVPQLMPDSEHGIAWLYENLDPRRPIGTSLCYWRKTWERRPFADLPKNSESSSEYADWLREVDALGVTSIVEGPSHKDPHDDGTRVWPITPRMVASIHGANTTRYDPAGYVAGQMGTSWRRAPEWDGHCRSIMTLEVAK